MTRDLAAEHLADLVTRELAELRQLRDAVLEAAEAVRRSNQHATLTEHERELIDITFDRDGMGPFVTFASGCAFRLGQQAYVAKLAEVSP